MRFIHTGGTRPMWIDHKKSADDGDVFQKIFKVGKVIPELYFYDSYYEEIYGHNQRNKFGIETEDEEYAPAEFYGHDENGNKWSHRKTVEFQLVPEMFKIKNFITTVQHKEEGDEYSADDGWIVTHGIRPGYKFFCHNYWISATKIFNRNLANIDKC